MSKDAESLVKSEEMRASAKLKYGFIPESVWTVDFSQNKFVDDIENRHQIAMNKALEKVEDKSLAERFVTSYKTVRGKGTTLSAFPYDLACKILRFYSDKGDTVFDPCMGHVTRMTACYHLRRNYIAYDVSERFFNHNIKIRERLLSNILDANKPLIELHLKSSTNVHLGECSVDFIFTSPPYWDIEYYGDEPEQLGYKKTYSQFLDGMFQLISECYRILKWEKYCVFNINDFRKDGVYYDYHADIARLGRLAGFQLYDVIIIDWGNSIGQSFASQVDATKQSAKRHEYLITFRKTRGITTRHDMIKNHDFSYNTDKLKQEYNITDEQIKQKIAEVGGITEKGAVKMLVIELRRSKNVNGPNAS